ncbi:hypothetical protein CsatB_002573 [Cannabis sativa]
MIIRNWIKLDKQEPPPEGRLSNATKGSDHLRDVFGHMGLSDQDIVVLSGGHNSQLWMYWFYFDMRMIL